MTATINNKIINSELTTLARLLLDIAYKKVGKSVTFLCISPISKETVIAALRAAKSVDAPIIFASSLNQVDVDGGYTGWTPKKFIEFVNQVSRSMDLNGITLFELDHGGPWLKDEHIYKGFDYYDALESVKKSIESFIEAGFHILHIDTSIDKENPTGFADIDVAARRAVELIDYSEDVARYKDSKIIEYEIGSDRWSLNDVDLFKKFVSLVISMLKSKNIDTSKIVFAVADVGTRVKPGNKLDISLALRFVNVLKEYGAYLKIHSADYLENPGDLPKSNIGGANIGPMFAHIQYKTVKELILNSEKENILKLFKERIDSSIISSDKLSKYFSNLEKIEEYKIGLASRYIWANNNVRNTIYSIGSELGIDIFSKCIEAIENSIRGYLMQLNLIGTVSLFKRYLK
jgi:hypothetical protein